MKNGIPGRFSNSGYVGVTSGDTMQTPNIVLIKHKKDN